MRKLLIACVLVATANLYLLAGAPGLAYLDVANVFMANQRINAGVGVNVAPGVTGTLSLSGKLFEQSRSTAMGEWISVPYNAANFTASAGGTWTVDSGDQLSYNYQLTGHTMTLVVSVATSTVAGTPTQLLVAIPGGFTNTTLFRSTVGLISDNGANYAVTQIASNAGGSTIIIFPAITATGTWSNSTNLTQVAFMITFQVS